MLLKNLTSHPPFPHKPASFEKPRQKIPFSKKKREEGTCYASTGELIKANDKHLWEGLAELKPGINDEMFDDKDAQGGYIKVYSECSNKKGFNEKVKQAIDSYGSFLVGIEDIKESDESIDGLPEWMGVYFGGLHTF